jgi:hypothetical protein
MFLNSFLSAKVVLISFDGSGHMSKWKDTLEFSEKNKVPFTYFISAPYFLSQEEEKTHPYWATKEIGPALIPFRNDKQAKTIKSRFLMLKRAIDDGCEIGTHLVGHYDGSKWTYEQWMKEFEFFQWCMSTKEFDFNGQILGVRAPYEGVNKDYFRALKDSQYQWDSSVDIKGNVSTYMGVTEVPIRAVEVFDGDYVNDVWVTAPVRYKSDRVIWIQPFDCAFISDVQPNIPPNTNMQKVFLNTLKSAYWSNAEPIQVCLHFDATDNGMVYYNGMVDFVQWAKGQRAEFLTYSQWIGRK